MWATELAEVTWIPVLRGDPRMHSHASRRRPAEPVPRTQVPKAAKLIVRVKVPRSGGIHCHFIIDRVVRLTQRKIRSKHYPAEALRHGAVMSCHRFDCEGRPVVVLKSFEHVAAGFVPRVASGHSARRVTIGDSRDSTTMAAVGGHHRVRLDSALVGYDLDFIHGHG